MKTALLLLLGGFLCGLHGAEGQDPDLLIIITKLLTRVQDLETKDQTHQSEVQSLQNEVQALKTQIQDLETKDQFNQSEVQSLQNEVQALKTQDQALKNQIQTLETKDQTHQSEIHSLKNQIQTLETKDQTHQSEVQALKTQIQDLETKDQTHQSEVQSLKNQIQSLEISQAQLQTGSPVAFYAGFYTGTEEGKYGSFDVSTTIKYKKVVTNVGGAYSADTGTFTAPLKGLYVFSFVVYTNNDTVVMLKRNTEILAYGYDKSVSDKRDSTTGVAVVTLEAGDAVYVRLHVKTYFYGFRGFLNSFSGFLLSPM